MVKHFLIPSKLVLTYLQMKVLTYLQMKDLKNKQRGIRNQRYVPLFVEFNCCIGLMERPGTDEFTL
jgi:hypothetical protein